MQVHLCATTGGQPRYNPPMTGPGPRTAAQENRHGSPGPAGERGESGWTFLTNHGHALVLLARDADLRIRDLAAAIGVTERTAQTIVNDLIAAGYLERVRVGTRSRYTVLLDRPFRHPVERDHSVGELLAVLQALPGEEPPDPA
jgi:MarR family